ncbi:alpha/beta hydrolase [Paenibacillus andongensis]|uniref:alpha/beta hydrolase n=1 Tax=Paenibacillus andongensis TaxID=2975482 RepID=UPI0021BB213E|nr:alpha/beta hydrolase-fold protein [Paenibacillus andongensis]
MNKSPYDFAVHLPADLDPSKKYPVIFTLHGRGSNEQNMFDLIEPPADKFIVIGIRGDLRLGAGFQYYELKSLGVPLRESFDEAIRKLQDFIQFATEKYPIDEEQLYLLGFSQGAIISMTLALTMGNKLKGIVALNGYIPDFVKTEYSLQSIEDVSVFISHGEYDSVFPIRIGHETAAYIRELTPLFTFRTYPTDHGVAEDNQRDIIQWLRSN